MSHEVLIQGQRRIFRSVHAGLIYDKPDLEKTALSFLENQFREINVELISSDHVPELQDDFGILGFLGSKAVSKSHFYVEAFTCLKIGFYPDNGGLDSLRRSLKHLGASIICHDAKTPSEALSATVFHFYESLTLPSLLNIDLADVDSIADGIGISFNEMGNSSEEIIKKLPRESYIARSALLHFSCVRNVTLEEVYKITKTISARKLAYLYPNYAPTNAKKMYKRIKLKMGFRVADSLPDKSKTPRISLTAILFGIKN
jgi:hypothetical protein